MSVDRIKVLDDWCGGVRPGLTFFFDLPVKVAIKRIAGIRSLDRFESKQVEFHERVRAAYQERAKQEPGRIFVIDADRSIRAIRDELGAIVDGHFFVR